MITAEQLREAKRLLQKGWNKGRFALDAEGQPTSVRDENAVSFCLYGALMRVSDSRLPGSLIGADTYQLIRGCLPDYKDEWNDPNVSVFNDLETTTLDQVLAVLDCAIAKVES